MARTYFDLSHTIEVMPAIHQKRLLMKVVLRVGVTHQGPFNASFSLAGTKQTFSRIYEYTPFYYASFQNDVGDICILQSKTAGP